MKIERLLLIVALALSLRAPAADSPPERPEPDHLEPVHPYPGDWHVRYTDQIHARFKLDTQVPLQMLVLPSFTPEYVVRMQGDGKIWDLGDSEKVFLSYSIADKSIWYSMPDNNRKKEQREVTVTTKTVEIPKPLALRLHKLWDRMLKRTRYPEMPHSGLDGTSYEFATWRNFGTVWSPSERKSPLLFIELGDSLIAYCKAATAERPAATKSIEDKAAQLEKYLDEKASK